MELGKKLKQARLEAGLSQRQLCGDQISRNMLSLIENGSAQPSMDTLRYLATQLGKPVSFFLGENVSESPNQTLVNDARQAWQAGEWTKVLQLLENFQEPDESLEKERELLVRLATLAHGEDALAKRKIIYAAQLLEELGKIESGYCAQDLERRRILLLAKADSGQIAAVCDALPSLDEELLLRAKGILCAGKPERGRQLLLAAEDHEDPRWNYLMAESYFLGGDFQSAADCYHQAESEFPTQTASRLEQCYRELGDFKQAYFYACKQR